MIILETARLLLREWEDTDLEGMYALNQDPRVMEYFPELKDLTGTKAFIAWNKQKLILHGFAFCAVELKATHQFIGFVGLSPVDFLSHLPVPTVEIGWRLAFDQWGKGYATEAAQCALDYAFNNLKLNEVIAFTVPGNSRSRNVMKKLGMVHDSPNDFDHPRIPADSPMRHHVLYRITKEIYFANR